MGQDVGGENPDDATSSIHLIQCPSCGSVAAPNSKFCSTCGAALNLDFTTAIPVVHEETGPLPTVDEQILSSFGGDDAVLVVHRGPDEGARFALQGPLVTVGRSPESTVFLDDVTVSREHARIVESSGEWTVIDKGSLNGTYVNRHRIEEHRLHNGDELQIGKYRFTFYQTGK